VDIVSNAVARVVGVVAEAVVVAADARAMANATRGPDMTACRADVPRCAPVVANAKADGNAAAVAIASNATTACVAAKWRLLFRILQPELMTNKP